MYTGQRRAAPRRDLDRRSAETPKRRSFSWAAIGAGAMTNAIET
jgi:hypothetical protein